MTAGIVINSELVDGAIIHPTLPMSYLGEIIWLNGENYTANYTINFNTNGWYTDPFFIFESKTSNFFYYQASGRGNSFSINFERAYFLMEGTYKFFVNEGSTNTITRPMFTDGRIYVGGSRG